ncbi:hypothetical protein CampHawk_76 [Bacillus phage CampHawk]|uniref:Uncharacterized protein n=2 Tax=Okubovirus camphawk TaxID=1986015 RepID=A0A217EQK2_9CAUD|nr:hypothetical protein CampHawk_76 [Bacillus phage CampHawk]AGY46954.1 hypothetical protein CampHawk_76 [Bacillus phage CampHawk]APZ82313.1 hypothetical protein Goe2_c07700 [Bacillus phage vB_BsuM-Goe2]UNY49022.1 hypothetical protein sp82g_85 [Bacillus phage SP82G]WCS68716.1 hypothetical protein Goe19_00750 [Bacillus phage vB_BsuM-Goe19]
MPKIQNVSLRGKEVVMSIGKVNFDNEGIADINDEKYYNSLLEITGFHKVTIKGEDVTPPPSDEEEEKEAEEEKTEFEFIKPKSHKEADSLAEELGMEPFEEGMQLKDKVAAIEEFQAKK